jgi:hypothetical protein
MSWEKTYAGHCCYYLVNNYEKMKDESRDEEEVN